MEEVHAFSGIQRPDVRWWSGESRDNKAPPPDDGPAETWNLPNVSGTRDHSPLQETL